MDFEILYQPQYEDLRLARRLKIRNPKIKGFIGRLFIIMLIVISAIYFAYKYFSTRDEAFIVIGGIFLFFLIFIFFIINIHLEIMVKEQFENDKYIYEDYRIRIDDTAITISSKYIRNIFLWDKMKSVKEDKNSIIFFFPGTFNIFIPKKYILDKNMEMIKDKIVLSKITYQFLNTE